MDEVEDQFVDAPTEGKQAAMSDDSPKEGGGKKVAQVGEARLGRGLCEIKFATVVLAFPGYAHTAVFSEVSCMLDAPTSTGAPHTYCTVPCRWRSNSITVCCNLASMPC